MGDYEPKVYLYSKKRFLSSMPSPEEYKEATRPPGWPFLRMSLFNLPSPPPVCSFLWFADEGGDMDVDEGEDDEYVCSEREDVDEEDEDEDHDEDEDEDGIDIQGDDKMIDTADEGESDYVMRDFEDIIPDKELDDLRDETKAVKPVYSGYGEEDEAMRRARERNAVWEAVAKKLPLLEKAEAEAAAEWDADLFVGLVTEWYELLAEMGHWDRDDINYAPHDPPIDLELGRSLGYESQVLELMQKMPYVREWDFGEYGSVVGDTELIDYRDSHHLREARRPLVPEGDKHPNLDPWIMPLVLPRWHGCVIYLDTKIGVVRAYQTHSTPPKQGVEWLKYGKEVFEDLQKAQHLYRRAPLIPAADYMRTIVEAYRSLEVLPIMTPYENDPTRFHTEDEIFRKYAGRTHYRDDCEQANMEKRALIDLYRQHGWPHDWHRDAFVAEWKQVKASIDRTIKEKVAVWEAKEATLDPSDHDHNDIELAIRGSHKA